VEILLKSSGPDFCIKKFHTADATTVGKRAGDYIATKYYRRLAIIISVLILRGFGR
jgi:hypothetical protein